MKRASSRSFRTAIAWIVAGTLFAGLGGGLWAAEPGRGDAAGVADGGDTADSQDPPSYGEHIRPILQNNCQRCHGGEARKAELDLSSSAGILKGSESGPVISPGKPDESTLFEMVHEGLMPPDGEGSLSKDQVLLIRRWIEAGARFDDAAADQPQITEHDVVPLLHLRCTVCHGLRRQEAGLDLRSRASMLRGGTSGPAMVPGEPQHSLILEKIHSGQMPPRRRVVEVSVKPMEPDEIERLTRWIAAGAPEAPQEPAEAELAADGLVSEQDRQFWSFQPPQAGSVPAVQAADRVVNPIDAFVLSRLEGNGLTLSPPADRRVLARRAGFDLTGLPPQPADVEAFVSDPDPRAYEKLIDRLLCSPHYGERWGRYWLDLAGYSDSEGVQNSDPIRPHAYRYRDYVVRALNADKPYDRFLLEQLAGDELADYEHAGEITGELYDNLVATGFLRMAADGTFAAITAFVPDRLDVINSEIEVLSSAVMGLTLRCARCHSHKFDPIPQRDYYRLAAVFKGAYDEHDWLKPNDGGQGSLGHFAVRVLPYVTTRERSEWEAHEKSLDEAAARSRAPLDEQAAELIAKYTQERIAALPEALRDDIRKMLQTPPNQRDAIQEYLAEKFEAMLRVSREELAQLDPGFKQASEDADRQLAEIAARRKPEPGIRALWDRGEPSPTYLLRRGNYLTPGPPVSPGVPAVLTDGATSFEPAPPWPGAAKTGRRLAFARWLTRPEHPLTSRVMVNRIWKHHFGAGLVKTLDNFGKTGAPPTHPELLDWLAVEFVRQGWSIKAMHRLIMTSATYRQASQVTSQHEALDPENTLLSRMPLRRLEAEALRDALLAVAGRLDTTPFGAADPVTVREDGLVTSQGTARGWRRSMYVLQRRSEIATILEAFDLPRMGPNCIERTESNVAPQALHLLNNRLVRELADAFADRIAAEAGPEPSRRIDALYRFALARPPADEERQLAAQTLAQLTRQWERALAAPSASAGGDGSSAASEAGTPGEQAARRALGNLCHALMNSAEFLYID